MRPLKHIVLFVAVALGLAGCGVPKHATLSNTPDLSGYRYVYAIPTPEMTSSAGVTYDERNGIIGTTPSNSVVPSNVIAGCFMKHGFIVLPDLVEELKPQTIVVNYGESGAKWHFIFRSTEVTIQLLDAATNEIICSATAESLGQTVADDIREGISKCVESLFE